MCLYHVYLYQPLPAPHASQITCCEIIGEGLLLVNFIQGKLMSLCFYYFIWHLEAVCLFFICENYSCSLHNKFSVMLDITRSDAILLAFQASKNTNHKTCLSYHEITGFKNETCVFSAKLYIYSNKSRGLVCC